MNFIQDIQWRPQIGDPSLMGWLTVAAYGMAAVTCLLAAVRTHHAPGTAKGSRRLWMIVALFMMFLCLNKQLDLQSLLTDIGRVISRRQGWYEYRRYYQKIFISILLALSLLTSAFILIRYRAFWKRHFLLASGLILLSTFIAVRAVSFHHVDAILKTHIGGVRLNWILELSGIALVWLAALSDSLVPRGPYPRSSKK
ncbi:MAG: hypothetical protein FJ189_13120 [Gammaproteobacteria bacterium]|nr:hypothetical protein [Gammaproteobacteria bacterium]